MPTTDSGDDTNTDGDDEVSPNCLADRKDARWRKEEITETTLQFFDTCGHCYKDGEMPEVGDVVLRSRNQHSTRNIHRLPEDYDRVRGGNESDDTDDESN